MSPSGTRGPDPIRALAIAGAYLICVLGVLAAVRPEATHHHAPAPTPAHASTTSPTTDPSTTTPQTTVRETRRVTTTTLNADDPGRLPQTDTKPTTSTSLFEQSSRALWKAVVDDDPGVARSAFFPQSAYVQIKAIANPAGDWTYRLLADFATDVHGLHAQLGADATRATFMGLVVPEGQAQWIEPGVEYNSGSYWRVYGSVLRYRLPDGSEHDLPVTSLISWRGEWYVVHLGAIR